MPDRGKLITFEGGDGAGKSTQVALLADYLKGAYQLPVITTREPGGTPQGEKIRDLLLDPRSNLAPKTEMLLHNAARFEHTQKLRPELNAGFWVLSDRFYDSTTAYQCYGTGVSITDDRKLREMLLIPTPDLTIFLDIPLEVAWRRRELAGKAPSDRYEAAGRAMQVHVQNAYRDIARLEPDRVVTVDGSPPTYDVAVSVRQIVENRFSLR